MELNEAYHNLKDMETEQAGYFDAMLRRLERIHQPPHVIILTLKRKRFSQHASNHYRNAQKERRPKRRFHFPVRRGNYQEVFGNRASLKEPPKSFGHHHMMKIFLPSTYTMKTEVFGRVYVLK